MNYTVENSPLKRVMLDVSITSVYANISIEAGGIRLLDNLDIPSSGDHVLNALVDFGSVGDKELKFFVRGGELTVNQVSFSDVEAAAVPMFTDISESIGLIDEPSLKYGGPSIADMDMDGDYDLILNNHNDSPSKLYWNNNGASVTKADKDLALWELMDLHGSAAGDYDNDGDLDLVISLGGGNGTMPTPPVFYKNNEGKLERSDVAVGITSGARGRSPRWADFDLDGDLDLALFNAAGINGESGAQHIFYRNKGDGTFELLDVAGLGYAGGDRVLLLDFNKDNIDDVLMIAPISLWQGNGDFTFTNVTNEWLPEPVRGAYGGMSATDVDLDNDGDNEIYIATGLGYYAISDDSYDFNLAAQQLDIREKGDNRGAAAGITSMAFSAPGDLKLLNYEVGIVVARYDGDFPVFLGASKAVHNPASSDAIFDITQANAQGWPAARDENGIYIGHTGDGQWQLEIVRDQFISWGIGFTLTGVTEVQTDWEPNNRNRQDILLINEGDKFVQAPTSWNIPKGGNHWGVTYGDFNNDSYNDLFVYRYGFIRERVADYLLLNTGKGSFEITTSAEATKVGVPSHADSGQAFDFDLDGDVDILSGDDQFGLWHLFQNDYDGNGNYTLVQVGYSPIENIDPISTEVIVTTANHTYTKRVASAGESHSQSLLNTIHFGLADESKIKSVSIRWRNGETVILEDQDANKLLKSEDGQLPKPKALAVSPATGGKVRVGVADLALDVVFDPLNANPQLTWGSSDEAIATVDGKGVVTGVSVGVGVTITATSTIDTDVKGSAIVDVIEYVPLPVEGVSLNAATGFVTVGAEISLTATIEPEKVDDPALTWSSSDESIATVDDNGVVRGIGDGQATITVKTNDGGFEDMSVITVETFKESSIAFDDTAIYQSGEYLTSGSLDVTVNYDAGTGNTVVEGANGGVQFYLREMVDWSTVANDYIAEGSGTVDTRSGTVTGSISLKNATPTADLPEGNFYFLWIRFDSSDGSAPNAGVGGPGASIKIVDDSGN